jgi:hypothetical protein
MLAIGAITLINNSIVHNKPVDWRVPIATGLGAVIFAGFEKVAPDIAPAVVYLGLVTIIFTRIQKDVPSPTESIIDWWNAGGKPATQSGSVISI